VLPVSGREIGFAALAGLGVGVLLDFLFLRRWAAGFYRAPWPLLVVAYLSGSAVALAFCMGFPFGNLLWGTLAGVYVGRRCRVTGMGNVPAAPTLTKTNAFTALVTSAEALPIGVLALEEEFAVQTLASATRLEPQMLAGPSGVAIVVVLSAVLAAFQFLCTRGASRWAYGRQNGQQTGHRVESCE
jgi:hypothetical protein